MDNFSSSEQELVIKMFQLEQKMDRIIVLLEEQKRHAKWAIVWKLFWVFILVILPAYLSYRFFTNFNINSLFDTLKSAQGSGIDTVLLKYLNNQ